MNVVAGASPAHVCVIRLKRSARRAHNAATRSSEDRGTPARCEQSFASANVGGCAYHLWEGYSLALLK